MRVSVKVFEVFFKSHSAYCEHPSLEILITLGCVHRKNRPNSMNLWQKPMSSYNKKFFLGVWPFLEIKAKGYGQVKNASYQKSNATFTHPTFDDYKLCYLGRDHIFTLKALKMEDVFFP